MFLISRIVRMNFNLVLPLIHKAFRVMLMKKRVLLKCLPWLIFLPSIHRAFRAMLMKERMLQNEVAQEDKVVRTQCARHPAAVLLRLELTIENFSAQLVTAIVTVLKLPCRGQLARALERPLRKIVHELTDITTNSCTIRHNAILNFARRHFLELRASE